MHSGALVRPLARPLPRGVRRPRLAAAYWMVLPAAALLLGLVVLPLLSVLAISLTDWQMGSGQIHYVGLQNFVELTGDAQFLRSLGSTLLYVVLVVPASVGAGLGVALLIHGSRTGQTLYRTLYFLPTIASLAAAAVAWQMLLHPGSGLFNLLLKAAGIEGPNWLKESAWALPTLAVIGIWERIGFNAIFFLSALRDIPRDLLDAAQVEGAGAPWDRFWLVVWPHLGAMTLFLFVIAGIHAFQSFETVAMLTQGGPGKSTQFLIYTIYQEGFVFFRTNYAAAVTVVFIAILALLSALQFARTQNPGSAP